jgi:phage gp36-like protein
MSYITDADIEERLGAQTYVQLTDDTDIGEADPAKVAEARLGAEGEAESYLAARYRVPVDLSRHGELAAVLTSFVLDLAVYRLHSRRPPVPEDVVRRHREALDWFRGVAAGVNHLPAATPIRANDALGAPATVIGPPREFSRDTLSDV